MTIAKTVLLFCCLCAVSTTFAQIDPDPDGIGVYFDAEATQVAATVAVGGSVEAYLIATNPSGTGTLELWEAIVSPASDEPAAFIVGTPVDGFNMTTGMPGNPSYRFAVAMDAPSPELQPIMVLATLEIFVYEEGPLGILVGGGEDIEDRCYYRTDDFYHGPETTLRPSSGDVGLPVAVINGPAPVDVKARSWDEVKAIYR